MGGAAEGERPPAATFVDRRWDRYFSYLDDRLGEVDYVAGPEFTCADVMVTFNLTSLAPFGGRSIDHLKNAVAYVERIGQRPAYQKAMAIAGPAATRPGA
jgi:glutathione S-transferase